MNAPRSKRLPHWARRPRARTLYGLLADETSERQQRLPTFCPELGLLVTSTPQGRAQVVVVEEQRVGEQWLIRNQGPVAGVAGRC